MTQFFRSKRGRVTKLVLSLALVPVALTMMIWPDRDDGWVSHIVPVLAAGLAVTGIVHEFRSSEVDTPREPVSAWQVGFIWLIPIGWVALLPIFWSEATDEPTLGIATFFAAVFAGSVSLAIYTTFQWRQGVARRVERE